MLSSSSEFDICYDDGYAERHVPRTRLHLRHPPVDSPQRKPLNCPLPSGLPSDASSSVSSTSTASNADKDTVTYTIPPRPLIDYDPEAIIKDPAWRLVYAGTDCHYACQGLVPTDVLEREPNIRVSVSFRLQTLGSEYPKSVHSLPSLRSIFWTSSRDTMSAVHNSSTLSRPKKELFSALLDDHKSVQLERYYSTIIGEGTSNHFM